MASADSHLSMESINAFFLQEGEGMLSCLPLKEIDTQEDRYHTGYSSLAAASQTQCTQLVELPIWSPLGHVQRGRLAMELKFEEGRW